MFEIIGINADELALRHDGSSNKSEYMITFEDGITNNVEISKTSNKEIRMDIFENDIHDIITYSNDGTMTVNGEVVDFGNSIGGISPRGRTSVYSKKRRKEKVQTIQNTVAPIRKQILTLKTRLKVWLRVQSQQLSLTLYQRHCQGVLQSARLELWLRI